MAKWVWVNSKPQGDRRFWSMFPLARVPFGVSIFDPQASVWRTLPQANMEARRSDDLVPFAEVFRELSC